MADVFISYKTQRRDASQHLSRIRELNGYSARFNDGLLSGSNSVSTSSANGAPRRLSHGSRWALEPLLPEKLASFISNGRWSVTLSFIEPATAIVRRGSLEDVFLRLTGRSLTE